MIPPGLYGMADAGLGDALAQARLLLDAGVGIVQLRAKDLGTTDRAALARGLRTLTAQAGALFIVNDHPALAREVGADGVHLGQDDGETLAARRLLGPGALLGRSTHNLDQVRAAQSADYLGFGPVFPTRTKRKAGAARGVSDLAQAVQISGRPVVAIGGITPERLAEVRATGVHAWAVISALHRAASPQRVLERLLP